MDARTLDRLIMIDGAAIVATATVVSMIDTRYGVIPALIAVGVGMMMIMHREMAAKLRLERPEAMLVNCTIEQAGMAICEALRAGDCRPLNWKVSDLQEQGRLIKAEYRWDESYLVASTGTSLSNAGNCNIRLKHFVRVEAKLRYIAEDKTEVVLEYSMQTEGSRVKSYSGIKRTSRAIKESLRQQELEQVPELNLARQALQVAGFCQGLLERGIAKQ